MWRVRNYTGKGIKIIKRFFPRIVVVGKYYYIYAVIPEDVQLSRVADIYYVRNTSRILQDIKRVEIPECLLL